MRKFVVTLFVVFLILILVAQEKTGRIIGKVVDEEGNPLPGAEIALLPTYGKPKYTGTNEDGSFKFLSLSPSIGYDLRCSLSGFKTIYETGIIVEAGQTTERNLEMEEEIYIDFDVPRSGLLREMELTKEQIDAFRSAKTVRLLVDQSYQDNRDKDLKNVRLPLEYVTGKFLKFLGLQVLSSDVRSYDLEIKIVTEGITNVYYGKLAPPIAMLTSKISFKMADVPIYAAFINTPSDTSRYNLYDTISEPIKARRNPFSVTELAHELMSLFERDIIELMAEIFGISPVIACLNDENAATRKYAAESLGYTKDQRSVEPLISCIDDEDKDVRAVAIKSLARIKDPRKVEPLIEALKHEDEAVRAAAAESLEYLEDEQVVEPLIACLKDEDKDVRVAAVNSLDRYAHYNKDPRVIASLMAALKDKHGFVRAAALEALMLAIDDPERDDILKAALKDKDEIVRATVLKKIRYLDDDQLALEYLLTALKDKSELIRASAAREIDHFYDDSRVVDVLIGALKDKSELVRAAVLEEFRYSDDPRVVEALIAALKDKDENYRMYIDEILFTITSNSFDGDQRKWQKWWKENKEEFIKKLFRFKEL